MALEEAHWPEELFADLDRTSPLPMYSQVASRLESAIRSGVIPAGGRIESEMAIAERLQISRPTIRRAIQDLVDKGLLVRQRGIGTQVVQGQVERSVELTSLFEDLSQAGISATTTLLDHEVLEADEDVAARLSLPAGDPVLHIRRRRMADGVPVAVLDNHLPGEFADLLPASLEGAGLYQLLRSRGVGIRIAQQRIGARACTPDEASLLEMEPGAPVLTMERLTYDHTGRAIELGRHAYHPDRYSFSTTLVAR
ncbi:GntR family transcriptional regulator [Nocardioides bruguierae]|uniref:GntR family transcriptional regulator n=1 Tax=Nocardioides bruguierae TaxID=2945102 RepID=A0A9X2D802_9ACTN|nr:GntR family transcriptional regulator [Nocardioides bruguierae]MCL8024532.1 GntR family transcriptional regulator [Nocardioides bruguierae]MCM0620851.1 GntR family transcriptional regulator [Nocardioides bruguierae]